MLEKRGQGDFPRVYRPCSSDELYGQEEVQRMIANGFRDSTIAHTYLFHGTSGTGKTTCARIIGMGLLCEKGPTSKPCGQCQPCKAIMTGGSNNFVELNTASVNGVDAMRKLRERFQTGSLFGDCQIFVFDECHRLTVDSQNLLLKEVENAPDKVYFIFCSSEPGIIIEPLKNRCIEVEFRPLADDEINRLLVDVCENEGLVAAPEVIRPMIEAAKGRARNALNLLQMAVTQDKFKAVSANPWEIRNVRDYGTSLLIEPKALQNGDALMVAIQSGLSDKSKKNGKALGPMVDFTPNSDKILVAKLGKGGNLMVRAANGVDTSGLKDSIPKNMDALRALLEEPAPKPSRKATGPDESKTVSPVVMSASYRTDIPGCHSDWFFDRLAKGHLAYNEPHGGEVTVSFENARLIVFWTKNPAPMASRLHDLDERGINYYFHYTLNDYEAEGFEPGLPSLHNRIDSFQHLAGRIGKERVIWRFDPLIATDRLAPLALMNRVNAIARGLAGYTDKLVFSFFKPGAHKKADRKLAKAGINPRAFTEKEIGAVAKSMALIGERYGMTVAACAEQDLTRFGIQPNKCIDDGLVRQVFGHDKALMDHLAFPANVKASGLRKACGCIPSVDIGGYSTCRHNCLYCYANVSEAVVAKNLRQARAGDENLLPARKSSKSGVNRVQDWSSKTINCCNGCSNGCLYCYAKGQAVHQYHQLTEGEWKLGAVREKDVAKSYPKYDQTVMFPSTHDITNDNFDACQTVLRKLLEAGNRVLVVSKPRPPLIEKLCQEFTDYRKQVLFRFTIGARSDKVLSFWEPNAPTFADRKLALIGAHSAGYRTSVSMEPMLDSDRVFDLVAELRPFASQSIWIGTLNHAWYIAKYEDPVIDAEFAKIEAGQTADKLWPIYNQYKDDPLIRFKGDFLEKLGLPRNEKSENWPDF